MVFTKKREFWKSIGSKRIASSKIEKEFLGKEDKLVCWNMRSHANQKRRVSGRSESARSDATAKY